MPQPLRPTCAKGHPYTPGNTRTRPNGTRICLTCHRAAQRAYNARQKGETPPPAPDGTPARQTARYKCSRCPRTFHIEDAQNHSDASLAVMVLRQGWVLLPKTLCALHAATAEAYAKPDYRRARPARTA